MLAALLIFLGTYLVLALGRLPGFRVDRTGAAIIGATLMVAFNVLTLQEATAAICSSLVGLCPKSRWSQARCRRRSPET